ncbi:hypothetical protein [Luteitalea sp.]|uniref:hypothetical protein n=1 Tax=Luteitalea sp. TaxID=2004800 RepID=UPI0025C042D1|nr:hypothetical protein [Luteitalea sp.]
MIGEHDDALDELAELLDIWGGDAERWPAHVAPRIAAMLGRPGAQALLAQARALDRVIATARDAPAERSPEASRALTDRIVAAAMSQQPAQQAGSRVVPFPARERASPPRRSFERQWQAAGLLAASLLVGVFAGGSLNVGPVVQELADAAGISSVVYSTLSEDLGEDETP